MARRIGISNGGVVEGFGFGSYLYDVNHSNYPANWDAGFHGDLQIGAGGTDRPFIRNGRWMLRVFERSTGKTLIYDYSSDMLHEEAAMPV